jgi:hypothetical protein
MVEVIGTLLSGNSRKNPHWGQVMRIMTLRERSGGNAAESELTH